MKFVSATDGKCANSNENAPTFGYDVITGCSLLIGGMDCDALRTLVENQQNVLIGNAEFVSRYGNPNLNDTADWVEITRCMFDFHVSKQLVCI